jgi:hypothetical protein
MSNWDFGYSREQADPPDRQYPPPPGGEGGPRGPARGSERPDRRGEAGWPGSAGYQAEAQWPDGRGYQADGGWPGSAGNQTGDGDGDPYAPQATPYPLTFERDVFDGRPTWSTGPQAAGPRHAARPTSPGWAVPQRPGSRRAAPWQTGPGSAAGERPTRSQAVPQRPGLPPEAPHAPWRATPPAGDQFGGDQYAGGQPGHVNEDRGHAGDQRGGAPYSAEPWSAGYSPGPFGGRDREGMGRRKAAGTGSRFSAGTDGRSSADPMRSLYPDSQADEEPWLDDSRGPRLDGPWWDPDSWSGWRHWLIPVGVAVLAAAIGAALVLLTGMHSGASAAVVPAHAATTASPVADHRGAGRAPQLG